MYFIYIVQCKDDSYYIGVTNNVERRIWEHNQGLDEDSYTKSRLPVKLVYNEEFKDVIEAISREKQLKRWTHVKKHALISGEAELLIN